MMAHNTPNELRDRLVPVRFHARVKHALCPRGADHRSFRASTSKILLAESLTFWSGSVANFFKITSGDFRLAATRSLTWEFVECDKVSSTWGGAAWFAARNLCVEGTDINRSKSRGVQLGDIAMTHRKPDLSSRLSAVYSTTSGGERDISCSIVAKIPSAGVRFSPRFSLAQKPSMRPLTSLSSTCRCCGGGAYA